MRRFVSTAAIMAAAVASSSSLSFAASFAAQVIAYTPGASVGDYSNPATALGAPDGVSGENAAALPYFGYPNVLSPFSAAYQNDEYVRIGEGGSITLRLERYVLVGAGAEFGVIENVVLYDDFNIPGVATTDPAVTFSHDRAFVEVSKDGTAFRGLDGNAPTDVLFNMPANYYLNAEPFDTAAPANPQLADPGLPFTPAGGLSAFDNKSTYSDIVAVFGGSVGGTWLDASASGLDAIGYVRFTLPDDNDPTTTLTLELDSILTNSAQLGALVPEPASAALLALTMPLVGRRRR